MGGSGVEGAVKGVRSVCVGWIGEWGLSVVRVGGWVGVGYGLVVGRGRERRRENAWVELGLLVCAVGLGVGLFSVGGDAASGWDDVWVRGVVVGVGMGAGGAGVGVVPCVLIVVLMGK